MLDNKYCVKLDFGFILKKNCLNKFANILKSTAILILTAIAVLFIHSELDYCEIHTDLCRNADYCLIVESAAIDTFNKFDPIKKIISINFVLPVLDYFYNSILEKRIEFYSYPILELESMPLFIKNSSYLI